MKARLLLQCFCYVQLLSIALFAGDESGTIPAVYSQIKDISHPTLDEYKLIQDYITNGPREEIKRLKDFNYENAARDFKIIGPGPEERPKFEVSTVNCKMNEKDNCVLVYSSFNRNYPKGADRLIKLIKKSDYKGHLLFRLGGWPDVESGSLVLAHVPYAFKVCFFKEARSLGYKRVLWLDAAMMPIVSINEIFKMIEEKGYFIMGNSHMVGPYGNSGVASSFGMSLEEMSHIPSCSSGILGIDFANEKGTKIIDLWYQAACHKDAFYSARPDQTALSLILHQMGIVDFYPLAGMAHGFGEIKEDSLFVLDRPFVHFTTLF